MGLRLGGDIDNLKLGASQVDRVYLGDTEVWPEQNQGNKAIRFGNDQYVYCDSWITSVTDLFVISFWYKPEVVDIDRGIIGDGGSDFVVRVREDNSIDISGPGWGGRSPAESFGAVIGQWYHVMYFIDINLQYADLFIDGIQVANSGSELGSSIGANQGGDFGVGGVNGANGCLSEMYMSYMYGVYTIPTIGDFYDNGEPVFLGTNGERPTGNPPMVYWKCDSTNPTENLSTTGGQFDRISQGALQACTDTPIGTPPVERTTPYSVDWNSSISSVENIETITADLPDYQAGDILIASISLTGSEHNPSAAGWTLGASNYSDTEVEATILYKIASGTEGTDVTIDWTGGANAQVMVWSFRNVSGVKPDATYSTSNGAPTIFPDPANITQLSPYSIIFASAAMVNGSYFRDGPNNSQQWEIDPTSSTVSPSFIACAYARGSGSFDMNRFRTNLASNWNCCTIELFA